MNYYIVVEGKCGESILYPEWIRLLSPQYLKVDTPDQLSDDKFFLISGNGYPNYLKIISDAVFDIAEYPQIEKLVIAVDAEEWDIADKRRQIVDEIDNRISRDRYTIIIQNPCLEAWALGNRVVCRRNPNDSILREYLRFYDVRTEDPEGIPGFPEKGYNKAQFSFSYLKKMLNDRYPKLTYTKGNPKAIAHPKYFERMQERYDQTDHINSFGDFLECFGT